MRTLLSRPLVALSLIASLNACATSSAKAVRSQPTSEKPAASSRGVRGDADPPDAKTLQRDILTAHNRARANAKPTPKPPLPALTWSDEAAKRAEAWAAQCKFEHNPQHEGFGQNLAAATPGGMTTTEAVESWVGESADYNAANNTCTPGKVCGHYTQVVWRNTKAVGCAMKTCTKNSPFGSRFPTWVFWVCDYTPPGNYVGERPY